MPRYQKPFHIQLTITPPPFLMQSCSTESLEGQSLAQIFDFQTCGTIGNVETGGAAALFCLSGLEDLSNALVGVTVIGDNGVSGEITAPCSIIEPEFKGADVCEGLFYVCFMANTTITNEQECLLSLECEGATLTACQNVSAQDCQVVADEGSQTEAGQAIANQFGISI